MNPFEYWQYSYPSDSAQWNSPVSYAWIFTFIFLLNDDRQCVIRGRSRYLRKLQNMVQRKQFSFYDKDEIGNIVLKYVFTSI